jgi:hypothetical protein
MFGGGFPCPWKVDSKSVFEILGTLGRFGGPMDWGIMWEPCLGGIYERMGASYSEGVFGLNRFDKRRECGEQSFCMNSCVAGRMEAIGDPDANFPPEGRPGSWAFLNAISSITRLKISSVYISF